MVSVAGLAPARTALKERALGLLCIHGVAAGVGIAPTPPGFQTGVQTDYTIQRGVQSDQRGQLRDSSERCRACSMRCWSCAGGDLNSPGDEPPVMGRHSPSRVAPWCAGRRRWRSAPAWVWLRDQVACQESLGGSICGGNKHGNAGCTASTWRGEGRNATRRRRPGL